MTQPHRNSRTAHNNSGAQWRGLVSAGILILLLLTGCTGADPPPAKKLPAQQTPKKEPSPKTTLAKIDHDVLTKSISLGRRFLLQNRTAEGLFRYQFHFGTGKSTPFQDEVRQAGALWGLALIHRDAPDQETRQALLNAFDYFRSRSRPGPNGGSFLQFPGADKGETGAIALLGLALFEFLQTEGEDGTEETRQQLQDALAFLKSLRSPDGHFASSYSDRTGIASFTTSGYADGEVLLLLAKVGRDGQLEDYADKVHESADRMYHTYYTQPLKTDPDSNLTKGFYQWCSMAFFELAQWDKSRAPVYTERTIALARWMTDNHHVLDRAANTGYAFEGLITAWEMARRAGDTSTQTFLGVVIDAGLTRLTGWQIDGPFPVERLRKVKIHPLAIGGILQFEQAENLRIDVTQHQMHAAILARRYIYKAN